MGTEGESCSTARPDSLRAPRREFHGNEPGELHGEFRFLVPIGFFCWRFLNRLSLLPMEERAPDADLREVPCSNARFYPD